MIRFVDTNPESGSLLVSEDIRANFTALDRANELRPVPGTDVNVGQPLTIYVESGRYALTSSLTSVFTGGFSPTFVAPVVNPRIDVLYINSGGVLQISAGTESASPITPSYPPDIVPIAEIYLTVGMTQITETDFTDVRPIFVVSAAGFGVNPTSEAVVATVGQTTFILSSFSYAVGADEILVFAGGIKQIAPDDYIETSASQIDFVSGRPAGQRIEIWRVGAASAHTFSDLDDISNNMSEAVLDPDLHRVIVADRNNPLATLADVAIGANLFAIEHESSGAHGPRVNIVQSNADLALLINKTSTGIGAAVSISNSSSDYAIGIVQVGDAEAVNIAQAGADTGLRINKTNTDGGVGIKIDNSGTGSDIEGHSGNWNVEPSGIANLKGINYTGNSFGTKTVAGIVTSAGVLDSAVTGGWTSTKVGVGIYRIDFSTSFGGIPSMTVTTSETSSGSSATLGAASVSSVIIHTWDATHTVGTDKGFHFMAIGQTA